jgi:predicted solute-binding protein
MPVRLGAVTYLNARPLVYGLGAEADRFSIRFDVPSKCATLLHERQVEVGLIPSIEYLHRPDYAIVPDVAVASQSTVASVAIFTSRPVSSIRTMAVDTSSRTSTMLLRILCARHFHIEPELRQMPPDLTAMLERCDAAMLIGDPALFADHAALGVQKIDFGEEWRALTGLPFVYAFWAGWPGALRPGDVTRLHEAKVAGAGHVEEVAREYFGRDEAKVAIGVRYLTDNVSFDLREAEQEGLRRFYRYAAELGFVPSAGVLRFYS